MGRLRSFSAICALATVVAASVPALAGASTVGHVRYAIQGDSTTWPDLAATARRQNVVVLHSWQTQRLRDLKAADPSVEVLVYQDLSAMNSFGRQNGLTSSGVGFDEADTAHPDWFLLNTAGKRFSFSNYGFLWAADVGNPGYQAQWADNVARILQSAPWDGVFIDDANPTMKYHANPASVAKYPTDAAYQAATRSMLAAVSGRIRAAAPQKLLVANMGAWVEYQGVVKDWLQFVDGAMDEMWAKYGSGVGEGYRDAWSWERQLQNAREAERQGKRFLAVTQSPTGDRAAARYGYASLLLAADSGRSSFELNSNYADETWFPEYDYAIGEPAGAPSVIGGVWTRAFTRGIVVVNPTTSTWVVSLGGAYSGAGLSGARSVSLEPHSALVLTRDADAVVPANPAPVPTPTPTAPTPTAPTPVAPATPPAAAAPTPAPVSTVRVRVRCAGRSKVCRGRLVLKARSSTSGRDVRVKRAIRVRRGRRAVLAVRAPGVVPRSWRVAIRMRSGHLRLVRVR
jgi:hypothetical protein